MPSWAASLRSSSTGAPSGPGADRDPEHLAGRPRRPQRGRGRPRRRRAIAEQLGQVPVGRERCLLPYGGRQAQRRQPAGQALRLGRRSAGRPGPRHLLRPLWSCAGRRPGRCSSAMAVRSVAGRRRRRRRGRCTPASPPSTPEVRAGPASPPSTTTTTWGASARAAPGRRPRLEPRPRRPSASAAVRPARPGVAATSRRGPRASVSVGCSACGSHLSQSQSRRRSGATQGGDDQVVRRVEGRQLADHRAGQRPGPAAVAGARRRLTRENARSAIEIGRSGTTEYASRNRRSAPAVTGSRSAVGSMTGRHQRRGQRLRSHADPDHAEVGVGRPPLPHPRTRSPRPQRLRLGMAVAQRVRWSVITLRTRCRCAGQIAQVVAAGGEQLGLAGAAGAAPVRDRACRAWRARRSPR